jgi:hypothetical protein
MSRQPLTLNVGPLYGEPIYPGNGYPMRPGENRPGLSPFGRLAMGQTIGKSSILIYDHEQDRVQPAPVPMLTIEGDDVDACQLVITLHPPRVIPLSTEEVRARLDRQNLTGEQTNSEVTTGHFPGSHQPIRWPPLEALIEFGTGGVSAQVVVDYVNGVTLSVIASYVRAHALISQSRRNGDIYGTSAAYYLAAHAGPGFATSHVQRTVFVGDVENLHESDVFDVPKFAKVVTLAGGRSHRHHHTHSPPALSVGFIRFWQSPDGTGPVGDFFFSSNSPIPVEVPNAGLYFSVYNESGHHMKMSGIFELSL